MSILIVSILSFNESLAQNKRSAAYDFNGDGRSDLLVRNIKSNSIFYFYIKAKNIQQHTLGKKKGTIVGVGDYNGDGIADILFRRGKSGAIGYWIVKQDSFKETVHLKKRTEAEWDVVRFYNRTDFDGNGLDDILWRSNKGELKIYYMTRGKKTKYKTLSLN